MTTRGKHGVRGWAARTLCLMAVVPLPGCGSCLIFGDGVFETRGRVVDEATGAPLAGVGVGLRLLRDGESIETVEPPAPGIGGFPVTGGDGIFIHYSCCVTFCGTLFGGRYNTRFAGIDHVEVLVRRGACETTVLIEVNADTVADPGRAEQGAGTLELLEPILVPPCDEEQE